MKRILCHAAFIAALLAPPAALAQTGYDTPQYSGPGAQIESRGMGERYSPIQTGRRAPVIPSRPDDTGFETRIEHRAARISQEMDRRREEVRRTYERSRQIRVND